MSTKKNSLGLRAQKTLNNALTYIILVILACIILVPIFFVIVTAFKTDAEISFQNFQWLPHSLNFTPLKTPGKGQLAAGVCKQLLLRCVVAVRSSSFPAGYALPG